VLACRGNGGTRLLFEPAASRPGDVARQKVSNKEHPFPPKRAHDLLERPRDSVEEVGEKVASGSQVSRRGEGHRFKARELASGGRGELTTGS